MGLRGYVDELGATLMIQDPVLELDIIVCEHFMAITNMAIIK